MTRQSYKYETASLELRPSFGDNSWKVINLRSGIPRQGHATVLLDSICKLADEIGMDLWLEAQRSGNPGEGTMSNKELERFYSKFGFKVIPNGAKPTHMFRQSKRNSQE